MSIMLPERCNQPNLSHFCSPSPFFTLCKSGSSPCGYMNHSFARRRRFLPFANLGLPHVVIWIIVLLAVAVFYLLRKQLIQCVKMIVNCRKTVTRITTKTGEENKSYWKAAEMYNKKNEVYTVIKQVKIAGYLKEAVRSNISDVSDVDDVLSG